MAQSINDGGRAFPVHPGSNPDGCGAGMSLRDWFAGQASAAIIGGMISAGISTSADDAAGVAGSAYLIADAMLAAREASNA